MKIKIKKIHEGAILPEKGSEGAACYDISFVKGVINFNKKILVFHTGLAIAVPNGYQLKIHPRSSLFERYGLKLVNQEGIVDSDYRGEILLKMNYMEPIARKVVKEGDDIVIYNARGIPAKLKLGYNIAQIEIVKQGLKCEWDVVDELDTTKRGKGGFGSTGL